ncbi:outer membrane assembly complex, YaeT protein [Candidatus Endolissoclinum faulkneri L2]|uniref:Outer membrane protein assembly factor BamA n=1 Tax=Candidatus Endolissoclinum faulkneri L2 TaxID=1193729 RepID=K7YR54_9PROT|nr:outer membrane protein assembly factor BamA [Candidatus Endolissoclinum faulkneri]AFX99004.1 outer membrane assembly complex, YaeT protein [Candidatus Endolissoclinum faulkneri L2]
MRIKLIRFCQVIALTFTVAIGVGPIAKAKFAEINKNVIKNIVIEGTKRIDPATVRSYLLIHPGDTFDSERLDQSLKALYSTGLFADITMYRDSINMVIKVVENPVINRVAFEGNKRIDDEELKREIQLRPRLVYSRTQVQQDVQSIIKTYQRSGYYAVNVEPKIIQQDQNRVDLIFEINDGELTRVRTINFLGNRAFTDTALRGVITTKEYAFYKFFTFDDTYNTDRLSYDRELLRRFYLKNGYADFRVLSVVAEFAPDSKSFVITFTVEEGCIYTFGSSDFEIFLPQVDSKALRKFVLTKEGQTYDADLIDDTIYAFNNYLGTLGYAFVDLSPKVNTDVKKRIIYITYRIGKARKVFIERINIRGNVRTLDRIIRREISFVEGDAFSINQMVISEQRIRNLGFFKSVDVKNTEGSRPDRIVVNVDVEEKSTGEISFGIGFSTAESIIGDVAIRERNLLGRGQDLLFKVTTSNVATEFDIAFTQPYLFNRDIAAGFNIFRTAREKKESSYDEFRFGGMLHSYYTLQPYLTQQIRYRLEQIEIKEVDENTSRYIKAQEGTRIVSQFGQTLTYDKRDNRLDPRDGYITQITNEVAGAGGDERFFRTSVKAGYYYPLDDVWGLSLLINSGLIVGIGEEVSILERFFVGASSFRGFARGGIGPRDSVSKDALGANNYYVGSIELSFPNGMPKDLGMRTFIFTDFGSVWGVDESDSKIADESSIRATVGLGLSFATALGTIRVDVAEVLAKEDFDVPEVFRLSFGTQF